MPTYSAVTWRLESGWRIHLQLHSCSWCHDISVPFHVGFSRELLRYGSMLSPEQVKKGWERDKERKREWKISVTMPFCNLVYVITFTLFLKSKSPSWIKRGWIRAHHLKGRFSKKFVTLFMKLAYHAFKNMGLVVLIVFQQLKHPMLSQWRCRFDP